MTSLLDCTSTHTRRDIGRRFVATLTIGLVWLAGCASNAKRGRGPVARVTPQRATHATTGPRGRLVVFFRRSIGVDPLASYFKLYASGVGIATIVYGGRNGAKIHHFRVSPQTVQRVQRLLAGTHLRNAPILNHSVYTYWVITNTEAHRLQQGAIPRSARPLLACLNAIAEENHLD